MGGLQNKLFRAANGMPQSIHETIERGNQWRQLIRGGAAQGAQIRWPAPRDGPCNLVQRTQRSASCKKGQQHRDQEKGNRHEPCLTRQVEGNGGNTFAGLSNCDDHQCRLISRQNAARERGQPQIFAAIRLRCKTDLACAGVRVSGNGKICIACEQCAIRGDTIKNPILANRAEHGESRIGQFKAQFALLAAQSFGNCSHGGGQDVVLGFFGGLAGKSRNHPPRQQ